MSAGFKALLAGTTAIFFSIFMAASVEAQSCHVPNITPEISFSIIPYKVGFRKGSTRGELQRIARRHSNTRHRDNWYPLGLTLTSFTYEVSPRVVAYPMKNGKYCALPTKIDIKMGYPSFEILIDSRYRRGTCQYNAIRDHENEHVDLYLEALNRFTPWLESRILNEASLIKHIIVTYPDRAARHFTAVLMSKIKTAAKKLSNAAARENARIDTLQSYRTIQAQCTKW
ncbi:MAG: hypothetical protein ACKVG9_07405 [Rhodospirillales bacterium]